MSASTCPWNPRVSRITTRRNTAGVTREGTTQAALTAATADLRAVDITDAAGLIKLPFDSSIDYPQIHLLRGSLMLISHSSLVLFVTGAAVLLVIPGPAVTYVVSRSIGHGRAAGLVSVLGIVAGTLCHVVAAALGISAVLASSALAFQFVKYLGAGYLIYLGIKTLRTTDEPWLEAAGGDTRLARIFGQGFLVNLLNPKTALFFLAFLPQFVDPARGHVTLQILQLGILFAFMGWCSDSTYALIAGSVAERIRRSLRLRRIQRKVSAGGLIALGLASAFSGARSK
jgi:threonine/homoserine/homoserine lactone efflux protein